MRRRRALRLMIIVLIPIAVWTVAAMIVMWPSNVDEHVRQDISTYSVEGLTVQSGRVVEVAEINCDGLAGSTAAEGDRQICGTLRVEILDGPEQGQIIDQVTLRATDYAAGVSPGQKIKLFRIPMEGGQAPQYQFSEFERAVPLIFFTVVFVAAVVLVARLRGLMSLIGLGFAFLIMVYFIFPALVSGSNAVMVGLVGGSAIMFVVLYAAHGFSARTTTALMGTLFGLIFAAVLGTIASNWANMTGVGSEDDLILAAAAPDLTMTSVLICGIMIAGLGVLNDVTITQASAVWELAESDLNARELFSRAMRIGRDHIASTVYTIAFATAGASLGTMLVLSIYQRPLLETLQTEQFAQQIIITLIGSIGLVLAVPLTTAVGVAVVRASKKSRGEIDMVNPEGRTTGTGDQLIDRTRYDRP